jgi:hypothetical protein
MRHITRARRGTAIAVLPLVLAACHGSTSKAAGSPVPNAPETALGAAAVLQAAGIYDKGLVHQSSGKDLRALSSPGVTYIGVVSNVFSPSGDEPTIWQFTTAKAAASGLAGNPPAVASSVGNFDFVCGSLLVLGDTQATAAAAETALAKRFANCTSVRKVT